MRDAVSQQSVLRALEVPRDTVISLRRAGYLRRFPESSQGRAAMLDRAAALELAFMAALRGIGVPPALAQVVADDLLRRVEAGDPPMIWVGDPDAIDAQFPGWAMPEAEVQAHDLDDLFIHLTEPNTLDRPYRIGAVHVAEIIRRLNWLFAEDHDGEPS